MNKEGVEVIDDCQEVDDLQVYRVDIFGWETNKTKGQGVYSGLERGKRDYNCPYSRLIRKMFLKGGLEAERRERERLTTEENKKMQESILSLLKKKEKNHKEQNPENEISTDPLCQEVKSNITNDQNGTSPENMYTSSDGASSEDMLEDDGVSLKDTSDNNTTLSDRASDDDGISLKGTVDDNVTNTLLNDNEAPSEAMLDDDGVQLEDSLDDNGTQSKTLLNDNEAPSEAMFDDDGVPLEDSLDDYRTRSKTLLNCQKKSSESNLNGHVVSLKDTLKDEGIQQNDIGVSFKNIWDGKGPETENLHKGNDILAVDAKENRSLPEDMLAAAQENQKGVALKPVLIRDPENVCKLENMTFQEVIETDMNNKDFKKEERIICETHKESSSCDKPQEDKDINSFHKLRLTEKEVIKSHCFEYTLIKEDIVKQINRKGELVLYDHYSKDDNNIQESKDCCKNSLKDTHNEQDRQKMINIATSKKSSTELMNTKRNCTNVNETNKYEKWDPDDVNLIPLLMKDNIKLENIYSRNDYKENSVQEKNVERSPLPPIARDHHKHSSSKKENSEESSVDWKDGNRVADENNPAMDDTKLDTWLRSSKPATPLTTMNHRFMQI